MELADGNGRVEILFYIIAAVVGIALNAYRNYSKRKAKEMEPNVEEPEFPDVFFEPAVPEQESSWEEEEYSDIEVAPEPEEFIEEAEKTVEPVETIDKVEEIEGMAALSSAEEQMISDDKNEYDIQTPDDLYTAIADSEHEITDLQEAEIPEEDAFDLKKAVIFAEILNPKYINNNY